MHAFVRARADRMFKWRHLPLLVVSNPTQRTKSKEKPVTGPVTNIGSTLEKCLDLSQLMLVEGRPGYSWGVENGSFRGIDDFLEFQEAENGVFSSFQDAKHTKKRALGPRYRIVNKYVKSTKQYWKERNRRKRAWQLSGEGLTYEQIAEKLGVSEKTVQRDIKKIKPYYHRLSRKYLRELERERQSKLSEELKGRTLHQQLDILTTRWTEHQKLLKLRRYLRHRIIFTIDLDDMTDGCPAIKPRPSISQGVSLYKPIYLKFQIQKDGKKTSIGEFKLS